jgi:hypothetical protein
MEGHLKCFLIYDSRFKSSQKCNFQDFSLPKYILVEFPVHGLNSFEYILDVTGRNIGSEYLHHKVLIETKQ